jgi:hypothetical protein
MKVALIACSKTKRVGWHRAKDLYNSPLFRFAWNHAVHHHDGIYILSAKHELLEPERTIEHYDTALTDLSTEERRRWSRNVARQIVRIIPKRSEIHFLCGKNYREFVIPLLEDYRCVSPLKGLSIGRQLHWYIEQQ